MGCRNDSEDLPLGSTGSTMVGICCARSKKGTSRMDWVVSQGEGNIVSNKCSWTTIPNTTNGTQARIHVQG
eukprot:4571435-Prorocentrum_lima.AAC.1